MITKEMLDERHSERVNYFATGKSNYGSEPKRMFNDNNFDPHNWNGGDGIIRQFTSWLENEEWNEHDAEFDYLNYGYELIAKWTAFQDMKYTTIILRKYNHNAKDFADENWTYDTYLIVYYKNRGNTECIFLNGKQIDCQQYIHLLNIIESSGYDFDLKP